jgi:hypothetical protein
MATKKKMGAPPKPAEERRTYRFVARLNQAEHDAIEAAVKVLDVEASTWARELLLRAAQRALTKAEG